MAFSLSDILSAFPDADASKASAHVTASGGETSAASVKLNVSAEGGVITSSATTVVEADGTKVETTAEAAASGETASTLLDLEASLEAQNGQTVATSTATAEAEAAAEEGGVATATTTTDAEATGVDQVVITQSPAGGEATDDGWQVTETGENAIATSATELTTGPLEVDALQLALADEAMGTGWNDVDWSL